MSSKKCPICLNNFLKLHGHHIVPTGYGGKKDGPLLQLCSACHLNIHGQAESEFTNNTDKVYLLPDQLQRARPYIEAIKKAKHIYLNASVSKGEGIPKKIIIEVAESTLIKCHKRKSSLGFTSLDRYLKYLIDKDIKY